MTSQPSASWRSNQNGGGGFKLGQVRQFRKDHMALISLFLQVTVKPSAASVPDQAL